MRAETLQKLAADVTALLERGGIQSIARFTQRRTRPLRHCGTPYQGGNWLCLGASQAVRGYSSRYWMTFKQALEYGAAVRRGETSTLIVKVGTVIREGEGGEPGDAFRFMKAYPVFNAMQIDGLPERFTQLEPQGQEDLRPHEADATADAFVASLGAEVQHPRNVTSPCYVPSKDLILMPEPGRYREGALYYADLLHELVHWTGAEKRLARLKRARFGDPVYALEELVAEIGAAMMCGELQLSAAPREDHAHYVAGWLRALKNDPRHLWTAGRAAEDACQFLLGLSEKRCAVWVGTGESEQPWQLEHV